MLSAENGILQESSDLRNFIDVNVSLGLAFFFLTKSYTNIFKPKKILCRFSHSYLSIMLVKIFYILKDFIYTKIYAIYKSYIKRKNKTPRYLPSSLKNKISGFEAFSMPHF